MLTNYRYRGDGRQNYSVETLRWTLCEQKKGTSLILKAEWHAQSTVMGVEGAKGPLPRGHDILSLPISDLSRFLHPPGPSSIPLPLGDTGLR